MKFVFKIIEGATDEIYRLCKSADLVIASHSHIGAIEAQACHKPMISVTLQPEMIPQPLKPRTEAQRLSEKLIGAAVNPMMIGPYNKIRKKYGLGPMKAIDEIMSPYLNLIPVSTCVVPKNPYWEKTNQVVGYWYEENEAFEPAPELLQFLESGSKPVIVALGAMAFESREEKSKLDLLIHAFQQTGMKAVIQGFDETLKSYKLPESVMRAGSIPHSLAFPPGLLRHPSRRLWDFSFRNARRKAQHRDPACSGPISVGEQNIRITRRDEADQGERPEREAPD